MKTFKTRLTCYYSILTGLVMLVSGLLLTGYAYTRSKGFYPADDIVPMDIVEVLAALPSKLLFPFLLFVSIVLLVELFVLLFLESPIGDQ